MTLSPIDYARHTAAALHTEAQARLSSEQAHQREFGRTILEWAERADRRVIELETPDQPDLFGLTPIPGAPDE